MESKNYQTTLSIGYLYIVILGILKEAFYYSQLGVDYFKYSTITDILLSPLSDITESVYRILIFFSFLIFTFVLPNWLIKRKDKSWVQKSFKIDYSKKTKQIHEQFWNFSVFLFCIGLMGFFVGSGAGSGHKTMSQLEDGTLKFEDKISYVNGDTETVHLIGKNTSFIFYILEGESDIKITPTNSGILKSITEKR